jgi:signal transduction histidine kinase
VSLRSRIFGSYLLLLTITIGVIVAALLLFLSSRPEPDSATYQRLINVLRGINVDDIADEYFRRNPDSTGVTPAELYTEFAAWNDVRILLVNPTTQRVTFDSAGAYQRGDRLDLTLTDYQPPALLTRLLPDDFELLFGRFLEPGGEEWLFTGVVEFQGLVSSRAALVSDVRDNQRSLTSALAEFGSALATPVIQAALVGLIVAFVIAAIISRTIARPLQRFARAAQSVAQGHYSEHVPEEGPAEMRAVAEALNQMSREVSTTQQSQRDFLINVSHDLKTPLTSIQGYSQAIMDGAAHDPRQAAAIIYDESARLGRMVTELTELARLQAGGVAMKQEHVDLGAMTQAIAQRIQVVAERKGISLQVTAPQGLAVTGDGDRLAQVLTNLMSNAIKYTPEGGQVWAEVAGQDGGVTVTVRDTGIGIPLGEETRIFERFYQIDKTRGPKRGTGLGLAISREIVLAHRGKISAHSAGVNQGTAFTVWLPQAAPVYRLNEERHPQITP